MKYAIIRESNGICENTIEWDGVVLWTTPTGTIAQQSDTINIGDECELVNGVWQKIV